MSLTRVVARNTITQALGRGTSIVLGLIAYLLIARHLGVARFGDFTTISAFLQFFGAAVDLGLYIYLAKTLGQPDVDAPRIVGNVFGLRIVTAIAVFAAAPLVAFAFPYPAELRLGIAALSLSFVAVSVTQLLAGVFQRAFAMGRYIFGEVLGRAALVGLVLVATQHGLGFWSVIWIVVVASVVNVVWVLVAAGRFVPVRPRFDLSVWRAVIRETWPIALSVALNVVYFKADTIILSLLRTPTDVGLYGAPYRVFEALISIPALFAGLLTPVLAAAFATDRARFGAIVRRGFEILLVVAVPFVVGAQFVSRELMTFVDPAFAASGSILRVLVFGTAAIFVGYLFSNAVVVVGRQRTMVWAYGAMAIGSVALYVPAITRYSYYGAASVTVLVEVAIAVAAATVVLRASGARLTLGRPLRTLAAALGMAAVMWLGRGLPWVANGAVGVTSYAILILLLRVVDFATLREILGREM